MNIFTKKETMTVEKLSTMVKEDLNNRLKSSEHNTFTTLAKRNNKNKQNFKAVIELQYSITNCGKFANALANAIADKKKEIEEDGCKSN